MYWIFSERKRTWIIGSLITGWLEPSASVLDLGTGGGEVARYIADRGWPVTPVDVRNSSRMKGINPVIYDGTHLPFADDSFDYCLLSTVLHHTPNPELIIREAARVAGRLIIIENIYSTPFGRWVAMAACSLANFQFIHPHTNKTDAGWKATFQRLGLALIESRYYREVYYVLPFFEGAYLLRRSQTNSDSQVPPDSCH